MKFNTSIITIIIAAIPLISNAQNTQNTQNNINHGEVILGGGLGSATPWTAGLKGNFGSKLTIKPTVNISGISHDSSEETTDECYKYTGVAPLSMSKDFTYGSHKSLRSSGIAFNYGLEATYAINPKHDIVGAVKGSYMKVNKEGKQFEINTVPLDYFLCDRYNAEVASTIDGSKRVNDIEASAGYRYWMKKTAMYSDGLGLDYTYSRESDHQKRLLSINQQYGFDDFRFCDLGARGVTEKNRVQGTWITHASIIKLNFAAYYEDRHLRAKTNQLFIDGDNIPTANINNETFYHSYNTIGGFANAMTKIGSIMINAKMEYAYTEMGNKNMNDYLPMAVVEWNVNNKNKLGARYVRRLIRPSLELLDPAKIRGTYTCDYGNPELTGMHVNNIALTHSHNWAKTSLNGTLQHIYSNDGFNALWIEKSGIRNTTWGNEGKRRAYSLTETLTLSPTEGTKLNAQGTVIWDKRIAEAIHMQNEHWGMTVQLGLEQKMAKGTILDAHAMYSEGNTVDLYSHESRSYGIGAVVSQAISSRMNVSLAYDYREYPKLMITQGSYVGSQYKRLNNRNSLSLNLNYKL